jgi:hypothetical protein
MSFSTYLLIIITTIPSHNAYKWMVNGGVLCTAPCLGFIDGIEMVPRC